MHSSTPCDAVNEHLKVSLVLRSVQLSLPQKTKCRRCGSAVHGVPPKSWAAAIVIRGFQWYQGLDVTSISPAVAGRGQLQRRPNWLAASCLVVPTAAGCAGRESWWLVMAQVG